MSNELVKGGQGRSGASVRDAALLFFAAITGAAILAGGALLTSYLRSHDVVPQRPTSTPSIGINARIESPPVTVRAILQEPERVIEKVKVAPVVVRVAPLVSHGQPSSPHGKRQRADAGVIKKKPKPDPAEKRWGEKLPPPKGE